MDADDYSKQISLLSSLLLLFLHFLLPSSTTKSEMAHLLINKPNPGAIATNECLNNWSKSGLHLNSRGS